jgi:hypothetical protein
VHPDPLQDLQGACPQLRQLALRQNLETVGGSNRLERRRRA